MPGIFEEKSIPPWLPQITGTLIACGLPVGIAREPKHTHGQGLDRVWPCVRVLGGAIALSKRDQLENAIPIKAPTGTQHVHGLHPRIFP
jgi:hypothetical protein